MLYLWYLYRKMLFEGIHNFIHLNLAVALLLALIVFVGGIETATENEVRDTYNFVLCIYLHNYLDCLYNT